MSYSVERLKAPADFTKAFQQGRSVANRLLVCHVRDNGMDVSRVGFTVSRRFGKAVSRNRLRRRLREIVRLKDGLIPGGVDLVLLPRVAAKDASYGDLESAYLHLMRRMSESSQSGGGKSNGGRESSAGRNV